ncbi:MAG: SDR family oxidoreductase [Microbacteriaceae bacterium]|nr:SDR family oxidoreductase [Cryobacterium sp.]MCC6376479.1 SDR family oxidoreductase [Microbacteriaceae bacterium]
MTTRLIPGALTGKRVLVTGSSRGIGADTALIFANAGAKVVITYRDKEKRAQAIAEKAKSAGSEALIVQVDLTDPTSVSEMFETIRSAWGGLDILVLNASGGMESGKGEGYALLLNRDSQVNVLTSALPLLQAESRVVFVTSHQAHFINSVPTMPEYEPVARSKRAGEDALRAMIPQLTDLGIGFVVVSGDMIEGTITALLLERLNPEAITTRRESSGKLYNVAEFAAEVAAAAVDPIPKDNIRLVGDTSDFTS